jgi:hypothetical protein
MSIKNKKLPTDQQSAHSSINLSAIDDLVNAPERNDIGGCVKRHRIKGALCVFVLLLAIGVFAKNGWLPHTDSLTGKKTAWYGKQISKNDTGSWNPFAPPPPPPTLQLNKEYIYAGSRLLAVADANANTVPTMDLGVWRPSTGEWILFDGQSAEPPPVAILGRPGDIPVLGDFDGDGKTDFAVYRPSEGKTYIIKSSDYAGYSVQLGTSSDVPVAADHDGDGKTDVVLYTAADHDWKVLESSTNTNTVTVFEGNPNDKPVPCDFDGDEKADTAYWRDSVHAFVSKDSADGEEKFEPIGAPGDIPVCADYDGDGKDDPAVVRSSIATWFIKQSSGEPIAVAWGSPGDTPIPNDYDDDGKVDIAVFHPIAGTITANWQIRQSRDLSPRIESFGRPGDIPVPAYYRR